MKKIMTAGLLAAVLIASVNARENVPLGAENLYELSSPTALTSGASVTGGAIFSSGPESLIVNPALTSREQRVKLNLADTFLFSANSENAVKLGDAFQAGIVVPFKMFVLSGYLNGTFVNLDELKYGNIVTIKSGLSKDITEKLSVGAGLNASLAWLPDLDWGLSANLGFVYFQGNLGFLRDFRYGVSALNLGKCYGQKITGDIPGYPTLGTFKAGVAASFVKNQNVDFGWALDLTTPLFQNLLVDAELKLGIKDMLFFGINEKFNLQETLDGNYNFIPSASVSFKFTFDVHKKSADDEKSFAGYLEKHDWSESELRVSAGYKNFYQTAHAVSIGADLSLGLEDKTPPVIELWLDEEEDDEADEF